MKYILLIEELSPETLPDTVINFIGFEEIEWDDNCDLATIEYDQKAIDQWKNSIHGLLASSPLSGKFQVTVIKTGSMISDEIPVVKCSGSEAIPAKKPIPREGLTIVRAPKNEGIKEYIVSYLHVKIDDEVKLDQEIFELEADKANIAFPAPVTGKIVEIYVKPGETIKPGDAILAIDKQDSNL